MDKEKLKIEAIRKQLGIPNQQTFADNLGISLKTYSQKLRTHNWDIDEITKIMEMSDLPFEKIDWFN